MGDGSPAGGASHVEESEPGLAAWVIDPGGPANAVQGSAAGGRGESPGKGCDPSACPGRCGRPSAVAQHISGVNKQRAC